MDWTGFNLVVSTVFVIILVVWLIVNIVLTVILTPSIRTVNGASKWFLLLFLLIIWGLFFWQLFFRMGVVVFRCLIEPLL